MFKKLKDNTKRIYNVRYTATKRKQKWLAVLAATALAGALFAAIIGNPVRMILFICVFTMSLQSTVHFHVIDELLIDAGLDDSAAEEIIRSL